MSATHNRRVVSTARRRAIVAHGMPDNRATVAAAYAFSNDTDRCSELCDTSFYVLLSPLLPVSKQLRQSCGGIVVEMPWRMALCGTHTLYSQLIMMCFVLRVSIKWCLLSSWNVKPCKSCLYAYIYARSHAVGVCRKMVPKVFWPVVEQMLCRDRTRSGAIGVKSP